MTRKTSLFSALLLLVTVSSMGCATERVVVHEPAQHVVVVKEQPGPDQVLIVTKKPPAPRREVRPRRPSSRHVWVGGRWSWHGSRYVWVSGRWTKPPRHSARWVAGHWSRRGGGYVWVAGHWRY